MILTVGSVRGAPGATSWSLLLAAAWPAEYGTERAMLEADVAGGVLGARYRLGVEPGAVSFTAGLRRTDRSVPVEAHGRRAGCGMWVVPGPESAEQASALWDPSAQPVADRLARDDRLWVVDVGRITALSPSASFAIRSAFTVLVCRSTPEDLVAVPSRVSALQAGCGDRLGVLVVGRLGHDRDELPSFFGVSSVWTVRDGAELVACGAAVLSGSDRARRSLIWRAALEIASDIATLIALPVSSAAAPIHHNVRRAVR